MAKLILMDEFHVTVHVPAGLPETTYTAIRRALDRRRFQADLGLAVRTVFRRRPALYKARVSITR